MANPVPQYEIGTIVYICHESSINHLYYIEEHRIKGIIIGGHGVEYTLDNQFTRREHEIITDREQAEEQCKKRIEEKYKQNLEMLEKKENFEKLRY